MADFREVLMVQCTDDFIGSYMATWAKYDLAESDEEPTETLNWFDLTLGETCKLIDDQVSDSLFGRKLAIKAFLETGRFNHTEEY